MITTPLVFLCLLTGTLSDYVFSTSVPSCPYETDRYYNTYFSDFTGCLRMGDVSYMHVTKLNDTHYQLKNNCWDSLCSSCSTTTIYRYASGCLYSTTSSMIHGLKLITDKTKYGIQKAWNTDQCTDTSVITNVLPLDVCFSDVSTKKYQSINNEIYVLSYTYPLCSGSSKSQKAVCMFNTTTQVLQTSTPQPGTAPVIESMTMMILTLLVLIMVV